MDEYKGIGYLRHKLDLKKDRVKTRYRFYEMHESGDRKALLIPAWLTGVFGSKLGWCEKAVDSMSDRLVFKGFDPDPYGSQGIFDLNNPDIFFTAAIREALIASCSFVQIAHDGRSKIPKLSVLTADNATGIIDEFSGLLKEGYAVLDRNKSGEPTLEAWFTPEFTEYYQRGSDPIRENNPALYPLLVPVVYRPDAKRPFGHSRITRTCMDLQEAAKRTLERAEVSAEFYSFPQKYVTGLSPDADPMDTWRATMSSMLAFDKDRDGDKPTLGQFQQQSMIPFIDQLKMYAALFAGETGLTLADIGFESSYPTNTESIKSAHESLRLACRQAQRTFESAFANVGFVAASVRDDYGYSRDLVTEMRGNWAPLFEPDASALATIGDSANKTNQVVPGFFNRDNLSELTGIEVAEPETSVDVELGLAEE